MTKTLTFAALALTTLLATGCEQKGPAERAGESIDDAAKSISKAGKDIGNAIEDACEDVKEGAGAKDKDC